MTDNPYAIPGFGPSAPELPKKRRRFTLLNVLALLAIMAVLVALMLPATRSAGSAARRTQCKNNLKQIALALHNYIDHYQALPPAYTVDAVGKPLHSWRTLILPYLEQQDLYKRIDLSKPWDHPANADAFKTEVDVYRCPSVATLSNETTYMAIVSPNSCFRRGESTRFSDITDGTSNTLMVIEVAPEHAVPWMTPQDANEQMVLSFGPDSKLAHIGGTQAALVDGSVRFLSVNIPAEVSRALISIAGDDNKSLDF